MDARGATSAAQALTIVVPRGLEPRTLRLLAVRFNQLSYETSCVFHLVLWCVVCVVCCLASVPWLLGPARVMSAQAAFRADPWPALWPN